MAMPLEGIRIIDWTIWQQGPVATMLVSDLGAEVIKIEERVGGDPGRGVMSLMGVMIGTTSSALTTVASKKRSPSASLRQALLWPRSVSLLYSELSYKPPVQLTTERVRQDNEG